MKKIVPSLILMIWTTLAFSADLEFSKPIIKFVPPVSKNTAGFLSIKNNSDKDIKLTKIESDISEVVELHNMLMENEMMVMRPVDFILVPKKGAVELKGGGLHVMFLGLKKPLGKEAKIVLKLFFSDGKTENVQFVVKD